MIPSLHQGASSRYFASACHISYNSSALTDSDIANICAQFPNEQECAELLYHAKWPDGFRCPRCGCPSAATLLRKLPLYQCRNCRHQTSLTAGTVMHRSRTPLRKWLITISLLSRESSVNAVKLASIIRVTYKTSWLILHKIRSTISALDFRMPLRERATAGLIYYDRFKSLRLPRKHLLAIATSSEQNSDNSYFKMKFFDNNRHHEENSQHSLLFFSLSLEEKQQFASRHLLDTGENKSRTSILFLPQVRLYKHHSLISAFKKALKWINRTFNGLATKHKQMYWDEWCFRYNSSLPDNQRTANEDYIQNKLIRLCMRSFA